MVAERGRSLEAVPPSVTMATVEQLQQVLHQNGEWRMRQMHEQQPIQFKMMMDQILANILTMLGDQSGFQGFGRTHFSRVWEVRGAGRSLEGVVVEAQGEDQGAQRDVVQ